MNKTEQLLNQATVLLDNQMNLIEQLRAIRIDKGFTQEEVGERMGVTKQKVVRFETVSDTVTLSMLRRYALSIGVTINFQVTNNKENN
jgi:transcriptional regulator with XRE-family HTH domain